MLEDERLSLINLIEVIFSSRNASIRPFAEKFFANVRLELVLTIIIDRAKGASLDAWIIQMASHVPSCQLSGLCTQLRCPTSIYGRESLLSWTVSSAETLVQTFSPSLYTLLHGHGPPHRRTLLNGNQDESTRISSNDDESPLTEVDRFGCAVQDDAHTSAADDTQEERPSNLLKLAWQILRAFSYDRNVDKPFIDLDHMCQYACLPKIQQ